MKSKNWKKRKQKRKRKRRVGPNPLQPAHQRSPRVALDARLVDDADTAGPPSSRTMARSLSRIPTCGSRWQAVLHVRVSALRWLKRGPPRQLPLRTSRGLPAWSTSSCPSTSVVVVAASPSDYLSLGRPRLAPEPNPFIHVEVPCRTISFHCRRGRRIPPPPRYGLSSTIMAGAGSLVLL